MTFVVAGGGVGSTHEMEMMTMHTLNSGSLATTFDDEDDGNDEEFDGAADDYDGDFQHDEEGGDGGAEDFEGDGTANDFADGEDDAVPQGMTIEPSVLEGIAALAYARAKMDLRRPDLDRLARRLATAKVLIGHGRVQIDRNTPRCHPPGDRRFALAHAMGHVLLRRAGYNRDGWRTGADEDRDADYLAAALIAPRAAFRAAVAEHGVDLPKLAALFGMKEVGIALRLGEVLGTPIAVISPPDRYFATVRLRGPDHFVWPDEEKLREWIDCPPPFVTRTQCTDDPTRFVLDASAYVEAQHRSAGERHDVQHAAVWQ